MEPSFSFVLINSISVGLPTQYLVSKEELKNPGPQTIIRYYPNPATNEFFIEKTDNSTDMLTFSVYFYSGRQINSGTLLNKEKINLSSLPKGLYLLKVQGDKSSTTIKILKK